MEERIVRQTHGDVLHVKRRRRYPPACSCVPCRVGRPSGMCLVNVKIVSITGGTNEAGEPVAEQPADVRGSRDRMNS
jgi:hypothetical protein